MRTLTLDEITDKYIGEKGTARREKFEYDLNLDLLGEAIKMLRKEKDLTQEELGKLVGVQKAQISKIENNLNNARFDTIMKVFKVLDANVRFNIEF